MQTKRSRSSQGNVISEGGLLPPELLERVRAGDRDLPGMTEDAYHLDAGQRIGEATTRSWNRLQGAWESFRDALATLPEGERATSLTRERFLLPLFEELGYGRLQITPAVDIDGRSYAISHSWNEVPIHLVGADTPLDRRTAGVRGAAEQAPHGLLQELLNRSDDRLWGFVSNGLVLRVLRDNASLTRQAYVEFDLESIMEGEAYADFVLLWLVCHQSRVEGPRPEAFLLEQLRTAAAESGTRALDRLREGVETAIQRLGAGFLANRANTALLDRVRSGDLSGQEYYRQLLRVVYRLIFLFVAEDRDALLHPDATDEARDRFERGYSTARLRRLATLRRGSRHGDLWQSLVVVTRASGGSTGAPPIGLPALGGFLFGPDACPDLEDAQLSNRDLLDAVRAIATIQDRGVTLPVDYRNLGSEELGSIYESLLAYHPELHPDAAAFELHSAAGSERKTSGSYYTPTSLINVLLDSALDPVLEEAARKRTPEEAERAVLALRVIDPATGSGHFLVAAAHRIARKLASVRTGDEEPAPVAMRSALRDVVGRCLYGVDLNPDAAELCRVSLWMEALEPGRPLSFLDGHIRVGNSLLGATPAGLAAGIPDDAFEPIEGDDRKVARDLKVHNRREREGQLGLDEALIATLDASLAEKAEEISALPEEDVDDVRTRAELDHELRTSPEYVESRILADAWCAAFVAEKTAGAPTITTGTLRRIARDVSGVPRQTLAAIADLASRYHFFHWHLEFPDVFNVEGAPTDDATGWKGGFDVVLANPPWERLKLQEQEFFASRAPEIANAANAAKRKRMIARLETEDPGLFAEFQRALREADGSSHFVRHSGRYPLCGRGDVNTYSVFAELMRSVIGPRGRAGFIVPTGIATDATTQFFFQDLVERHSLVSLYDFENRRGLFPGIDSRIKFALITLSGRARPADAAEFVNFALEVADLADPEKRFTLSTEDFALLNPNTRTLPTFRTRRDAEITKGIYLRVPILSDESKGDAGNPWGISFMRMFDMANDSDLFFTEPGPGRVPLYEAKMVHHYSHRWATYEDGEARNVTEEELKDPSFTITPRYWVAKKEVDARLAERWDHDWLLGWRDIARNTDYRTVIASVIPRVGVGHTLPVVFSGVNQLATFHANLTAFVFDFSVRQKLGGTHLTYSVLEQVPVLLPGDYKPPTPWERTVPVGEWVKSRVISLAYTSDDMRAYARDHGYMGPPFSWDRTQRAQLMAELDAAFFHLYGIGRQDVDYILDTFPVVADREHRELGEYRTKRLILECYDEMARAIERRTAFVSRLDPALGTGPHWRDVPPPPSAQLMQRGEPVSRKPETPAREGTEGSSRAQPQVTPPTWVAETDVDPDTVHPSMRVRHRIYGVGQVVAVQPGLSPVLTIDFGPEAKMVIFGRGYLEIDVSDEGGTG